MPLPILPFGAERYLIQNSLRFRRASSARLSNALAVAGDRKTFEVSCWVKRGQLAVGGIWNGSSSQIGGIRFMSLANADGVDDALLVGFNGNNVLQTNAVFRDTTGWYHILLSVDTTHATSSERVKLYVNGVQITSFSFTSYPAQNTDLNWNSTDTASIGASWSGIYYFDGLISEFISVSGTRFGPNAYGRFNAAGHWVPRRFNNLYGAKGFHLKFLDASAATAAAIGKDSGPNAINWTPTNISVTAGPTFDQMRDTPTRNMPTLTPLIAHNGGTLTNANLGYTRGSTSAHGAAATQRALPTTGKHGWEVISCAATNNDSIGVADITVSPQLPGGGSEIGNRSGALDYIYRSNGIKASNGSTSAYGATFTSGSAITVLWDADAGQISFRKDGVDQGVAFSGITPVAGKFAPAVSSAESSGVVHFNFGQRPFAYALPAGYTALGEAKVNTTVSSGTFTGNASSDGRVVDIGGTPTTLTINGNAVTWGTHAIKLANGFKIITSSSSYNTAGSNSWSATGIVPFQAGRNHFNNAQVN